ncbi:hypothetical protein GW17_00044887 [Ensete ventricosum]|nr:hypothetical protein GW17_00044887 [Ensete ventricosum]
MFEVLPASSFDLVTSLCTSLRRSFMRQSCIQNELVESDDKVSGSCGACSVQRCGAVEFSRTIEGVSDWVLEGFGSVGPGVRGYCSPVGCCVYPDTSLVTRCRGSRGTGRGLAWHVSSVAPSVLKGDS